MNARIGRSLGWTAACVAAALAIATVAVRAQFGGGNGGPIPPGLRNANGRPALRGPRAIPPSQRPPLEQTGVAGRDPGGMPSRSVVADAGSAKAPLLFCVGMHIEPMGAEVSALAGRPPRPGGRPAGAGGGAMGPRGRLDYNEPAFFQRHIEDLRRVVSIVEKYGGRLTVQAQTPFTRLCAEQSIPVLAELLDRGHEIGLHFHEDAHLGPHCETLPSSTWAAVMREEMDWIRKACPGAKIRYWSGGNNYPDLLRAAADAGLDVMSDHKNPHRQQTFPQLLAVQPWRPAGGPTEDDIAQFARHDPDGKIVYLPDGIFADSDFAARKRAGDAAYLDAITEGLELSLRAARADRVNVFHLTIHPGELHGSPAAPFAAFETWLRTVLAPLVRDGRVKWATYAQMADAWKVWEKAHPGTDPRGPTTRGQPDGAEPVPATPPASSAAAAPAAADRRGWITFAVNTHDTYHPDESADTLHRLIGIFRKHGVRGDFYFTAPIVELYAQRRPDIIKELKESGMGISYHLRPPHPALAGFDRRLRGLDDAALEALLRDYETYRTDPATGDLQKDRPGGYRFVAETFGTKPVCVSPQAQDPKVRSTLGRIYRDMGARVVVAYHESGTDPAQPFELRDGLLARPSDFSITRWPAPGDDREEFWWNRLAGRRADPVHFDPSARLKEQLAAWKGAREPFATALIHENNFPRSGPEAWKAWYFSDPMARTPRSPPYDLKAPDPSTLRGTEEREAIFNAYEQLVATAAARMRVVTAAEVADLAAAARR